MTKNATPPSHRTFCMRTGKEFHHPVGLLHRVQDGPGPSWLEVWAYGPVNGGLIRYRNEAAKVAAQYMDRYCEMAKGGPHWPALRTPAAKRMGVRIAKAVEASREASREARA